MDNFGARPVTIFSGVMVAGGLMLSAFAPNVQFLIFSYGIVVGKETLDDNLGEAASCVFYTALYQRQAFKVNAANSPGDLIHLTIKQAVR